jgi:fructokinase
MIVVAGEALMDVFDAGPTPTGQALDARIGGSPYNVALGLARLGRAAAFCGAVSRGFLGERLLRSMADEGLDLRLVQRVDAPVSLCLVGLDAHGVPRYDFIGERGADRLLDARVLEQLPPSVDALHIGSYATVVEPVATVQERLVDACRARGALIAYDPNVRTVVEPSLDRWRDTLHRLLPRCDLLKISDEDLHTLFPGADEAALTQAWLAQGVRLVVVTRGGAGATAWRRGRPALPVAASPVTVVDTVGAGDTFQASLLAGLAETGRLSAEGLSSADDATLSSLLAFAARAAGITCSRRGADLPRRHELPALA